MLLFGWNPKAEKCITLHLQPLYRLDNSPYHLPDTVSYLLPATSLPQDTFDFFRIPKWQTFQQPVDH